MLLGSTSGLLVLLGLFVWYIATTKPVPAQPQEIVLEKEPTPEDKKNVIGVSVEGRDIEVKKYGNGSKHILFVGGIHGGYEWNSVLLAYEFIDYVDTHPEIIPASTTVAVIPSLNPDGVYRVVGKDGRFTARDAINDLPVGAGRFNAHNVDLNRNFNCDWKPKSTWKGKVVSAGTSAFSEPEARALRDFVESFKPEVVIFWHSKAGAVYASECKGIMLPETVTLMNLYAKASGYKAFKTFDQYEISGDAEGWLASIGIPAITVEFTTHESTDWSKNILGIKSVLSYYSK